MTQKKSSAKAASIGLNDRSTSPKDVRNMYIAILGRPPESRTRITERANRPLSETIGEMVRSSEFGEVIDQIARGDGLPLRARIGIRRISSGLLSSSGAGANCIPTAGIQ